ncbi:hypothetical protein BJP36_05940 [Moorena producens JHB]|uniref:Uncharacterized protein n=1 Tax=Moorena producens (strain JHB) TaxID=1454205 RepID=A0A1D9FW73_MOOP1|nr:hypothetical protein [Moorena producens]AOY79524.1 hypothetical protein BJP36_05940 [Moorena producens JHB]
MKEHVKKTNSTENQDIQRLQLFIYLVPIFGLFPALWTLYHSQGNREEKTVSRLSVTLAFAWLLGYSLLSAGTQLSEFWTLRLLFLNAMLTSGYFLLSFAVMVRLWHRQSARLPWISRISEGIVGKYLS